MKKLLSLLLALALCLTLAAPVFAQEELPLLIDDADILDAEEEAEVLTELERVSLLWDTDVAIVTVTSFDGSTIESSANAWYEGNPYRADGILLLLSMQDRDWSITVYGSAEVAFDYAAREYIGEEILWYLSDDEFYDAFLSFASLCDDFLRQADSGTPYGEGNLPKEPFSALYVLFALVIALVVAFIVTAVMKGKLKSVAPQRSATNYVKAGSLHLTRQRDIFLYRNVTCTPKPQNNSHSGAPHSGSIHSSGNHTSGKF